MVGTIALPIHADDGPKRARRSALTRLLLLLPLLALLFAPALLSDRQAHRSTAHTDAPACPVQGPPLAPQIKLQLSDADKNRSVTLLSEAVQIATVSYDDNGTPMEDPRWAPFFEFKTWLLESYPAVFKRPGVMVEFVNHLGILTTIQGSDRTLKPLLLMSHYDVTPAPPETHSRWTHPPFSGHIDETSVWGRGASDDKTLLVAQYTALSLLLAQDSGFYPRRTILLAHGFDEEEVFARQGAGELAKWIEKRYGKGSMLLVVDEGTSLQDGAWGAEFAIPATSEKGYMDVKITVGTTGGHSSVPPAHSGIGIMSDIVHALEANTYPASFAADDPILGFLACAAEHSPDFPKAWNPLLADAAQWPDLARAFGETGAMQHALVTTTQAIDVITGGSKVNSLPEEVTMLMNHRVAFASSLAATQAHLVDTLRPVAAGFGLELSAFDNSSKEDLGAGYVKIELLGVPLEPAPRAHLSGGVWDMFAGSIKHAFPTSSGADRVVSPFSSTGNTDTKVYHNLSRSVFRFKGDLDNLGNAHTVNERASIAGHYAIINWIHTLVQNADAYDGYE